MDRRRFVAGMAGALVAPLTLAQRGDRQARVVFVSSGVMGLNYGAFRDGLVELGRGSGRDVLIENRAAPADAGDYGRMAEEFVRDRVDVVAVSGVATRPMIAALRDRVPVAFGYSGDPVEAGLVKSMSHPGRNATGVSMLALELVGKRISLLREVMPGLKRIAVIANPAHSGQHAEFREASAAAERLGLEMRFFPVRTAADFQIAFDAIVKSRIEAMDFFPDSLVMNQRKLVAEFSVRERKPAISGWGVFATDGNVMAYGPNFEQAFRQVATHVDRMLRGNPATSLPVEYPTRVEFVVNRRTARAIGLTIPQSVLLRADRVIE